MATFLDPISGEVRELNFNGIKCKQGSERPIIDLMATMLYLDSLYPAEPSTSAQVYRPEPYEGTPGGITLDDFQNACIAKWGEELECKVDAAIVAILAESRSW
jgi:hypothetical protein